jgi:hypothetical protein
MWWSVLCSGCSRVVPYLPALFNPPSDNQPLASDPLALWPLLAGRPLAGHWTFSKNNNENANGGGGRLRTENWELRERSCRCTEEQIGEPETGHRDQKGNRDQFKRGS